MHLDLRKVHLDLVRVILASAQSFLTFLGGYSLFVGPIVGISICDYYFVRNGNLHVNDMFTSSVTGRYWYTNGVHWRAFVTYLCGIILPFPGFIAAFGYNLSLGAQRIYSIGWIISIVPSIILYWALSFIGSVGQDEKERPFESWIPDWIQYWESRGVFVTEAEAELVKMQSINLETKAIEKGAK